MLVKSGAKPLDVVEEIFGEYMSMRYNQLWVSGSDFWVYTSCGSFLDKQRMCNHPHPPFLLPFLESPFSVFRAISQTISRQFPILAPHVFFPTWTRQA
jgi:hypothetical protein